MGLQLLTGAADNDARHLTWTSLSWFLMLTISGNPPAVSQFAMENGPLIDDLPIEKYERIHCYVKKNRVQPQRLIPKDNWVKLGSTNNQQLKDRITPHVTNFFRLRLSIEKQEGKRKYKSECSCTVSE